MKPEVIIFDEIHEFDFAKTESYFKAMSHKPSPGSSLDHIRDLLKVGCEADGFCFYCRAYLDSGKVHHADCAYVKATKLLTKADGTKCDEPSKT